MDASPNRLPVLVLARSLGLALSLGACAGAGRGSDVGSGSAAPAIEVVELGTLRQVSLCSGIWFGSAPAPEDLDLARRRGVRRVLVIDDAGPEGVEALCDELELELLRFRIRGARVDEGEAREVVGLLSGNGTEARDGDTLLYSEDGSMAAALFAVHRVLHDGVALERALVEARRAGMRSDDEDLVRRLVSEPAPPPPSARPR